MQCKDQTHEHVVRRNGQHWCDICNPYWASKLEERAEYAKRAMAAGKSQNQIALEWGVTRQRVSQVLKRLEP